MKPTTKALDLRKLKSETSFRELSFTRELMDQETRTIELAFASEVAYERWWGVEVLDCGASAVRLERLLNKAPLLFNHNRDELLGVVETVSLGQDKVCRATVRFGKGEVAEQRYQDVLDGILTKVSVGYMIHEMLLEKEVEGVSTYRISDWEPFEISMVTIPADDSVGLGRGFDIEAAAPTIEEDLNLTNQARASGLFITQKETKMEKTIEVLEQEARAAVAKMSATELEQKRRDALVDVGVRYSDFLTMQDVQRAVNENHTVMQLQDVVIERQKTKHSDTSGQEIGLSKKEVAGYSIAKAVRALVTGDWKDAGLERAAAEASGARFGANMQFTGRNLIVPFDVFQARDFTAGTAAEAGNLIATDLRGDLFADVLRNKLSLGNLGATMLYGLGSNLDIPRKTLGSSLGFLAEIGAAAETQPTTAKITMSPKRIGGFVEFSKQGVIQSAMAVEPMLRQDLLGEYLVQVENAGINGSGAANNARGIRNVAGIGSVVGGVNGAQLNWGHVVGLESAVANVNAEPGANAGYLVNTKTRGWAKQTLKAAGFQQFVWQDGSNNLNSYKTEVSNTALSNLVKGTSGAVCSSLVYSSMWDMLVIGTFGAIELTLDEVTQATNGMNRLILNAFIDVGCRRPANFAVMDDALTA